MKKPKRIVCILNYAPHYRSSIYHLMAKEFRCDFYFGANLPNGKHLEKMNLNSLPGFKKESRVFKFRYVWQCNVIPQVFKSYNIYILTGNPSLSNILLMMFAKIFRKKVVLWTHGLKTLKEGRNPLVRFFFNNATVFFLYGHFGKEMMLKYGIPESRLFVINNSLDYDRQLKVRKSLKTTNIFSDRFKNNDPVLIFTGRLLQSKKIDMLLQTQQALLSNYPFNFAIIGEGPEREKLEEKAKRLELMDRVWFYGACYDEKVLGNLFYNATLTVSPGNVGLTAIHSMMYGTPVLTHNNRENQGPEFEAVKEGQTGLFFNENDTIDLEDKIKHWLDDSQDRDAVRENCFGIIDNYFNPGYQIRVMRQAMNRMIQGIPR